VFLFELLQTLESSVADFLKTKLALLIEQGNSVIQHSDEPGSISVKEQMSDLMREYESMLGTVISTKNRAEQSVKSYVQFEKTQDKVTIVMEEADVILKKETEEKQTTLGDRKAQLENLQVNNYSL